MLPRDAGELSAEPTEGASAAQAELAPSGPLGHLPRSAGEDLCGSYFPSFFQPQASIITSNRWVLGK